MTANLITIVRIPLLALAVALLYQQSPVSRFIVVGLIALMIGLDSLDGFVARRLQQASVIGSVLDIAADRAVELVLWVVFAHLGLISIVIPLLVIVRGIFVDAFRAVAPSRDLKPFDLMQSQIGRFLVKSPLMRSSYAIVKAVTFCLLALLHGLAASAPAIPNALRLAGHVFAWLSVALCLLRGIPVLIEAPTTLMGEETDARRSC